MCSQEADPGYPAPFSSSASHVSSPGLDGEIIEEIERHKLPLHVTWLPLREKGGNFR